MGSIQKSFLVLKSFNNYILTDVQRNYEHEIAEFSVACMSTHKIKILGTDGQNSIVLFESKKPNGVLITSGWQGDEPAGWEASEELVSLAPECSFIPWISPGCFLNRTHTNNDGRNIDRDWPEAVTKEGFALKNNIELLTKLGNRCCLSLQEDCKRSVGYFYGWETTTNLNTVIRNSMKRYVPEWTQNTSHKPPNGGRFCEYAVQSGCRCGVQLETPADGTVKLSTRILCLVATTQEIIKNLEG